MMKISVVRDSESMDRLAEDLTGNEFELKLYKYAPMT